MHSENDLEMSQGTQERAQGYMGWGRTSLSQRSTYRGTRDNLHNITQEVLMLWLIDAEWTGSNHLSYARASIGSKTTSYPEAKSSVLPLIMSPCEFGSLLFSWRRISQSLLIKGTYSYAQLELGWRRGSWPLQLYWSWSLDRSLVQPDARSGQMAGDPHFYSSKAVIGRNIQTLFWVGSSSIFFSQ